MDTDRLENQLSIWNKLMYMALGFAILGSTVTWAATIALVRAGNPSTVAGIAWFALLIAVTLPGFLLLLDKRWKGMPFSKEWINTAFGYLLAGWLLLSVPILLGGGDIYNFFFIACTIFLGQLYWRFRKKLSSPEELFP